MAIPELQRIKCGPADFQMMEASDSFAGPVAWTDSVSTDEGEEWIAVSQDLEMTWFRFLEVLIVRARPLPSGGHEIVIDANASVPAETVRHLLLDEVIPALIATSASTVLHGAANVIGNSAIAFLGPSGGGKSTLAASLARAGCPVLSDDCVVVDEGYAEHVVQPSYPSIRLWNDSAEHFLGPSAADGLPFAHYTAKLRYSEGFAFADAPAQLRGILCLDSVSGDRHTFSVKELRGHAAIAALLGCVRHLPRDTRRAAAFERVVKLAESVVVACLAMPSGFGHLEDARGVVLRWASGL